MLATTPHRIIKRRGYEIYKPLLMTKILERSRVHGLRLVHVNIRLKQVELLNELGSYL